MTDNEARAARAARCGPMALEQVAVRALTPNQWTILEALAAGPRWARSFQYVKPLVADLVDKGFVERCRPHLGRARNMLRLTDLGCALLAKAAD